MSDDQLIEELLNQPDDAEQEKQTLKDLLPTPGRYTSVPPMVVTKKIVDKKGSAWEGRPIIMFYGEARMNHEGGRVESQRFRFTMSPVRRDFKNGKPDFATQLYANAKQAFQQAYGRPAENANEVAAYVEKYPVVLNIRHGQDSSGTPSAEVRGIAAVRE